VSIARGALWRFVSRILMLAALVRLVDKYRADERVVVRALVLQRLMIRFSGL
jgi:hypothetical protein